MKQTTHMHRPTAVTAAVAMILSLILHISAALSTFAGQNATMFLIELFGNALLTVAISVILFRGRKDTVAGAVFLIAVVAPVLSMAYDLLLLLIGQGLLSYTSVCMISGLALAIFRGLLALECFSRGKISAGDGRAFLWALPILCFGLEVWAQIILNRYYGSNIGGSITSSLIYAIPQWLGPVLMGVSISIPEKPKDC